MKNYQTFAIAAVLLVGACGETPPFHNTVYFEPDVVTADDPSAFRTLNFQGEVTEDDYANNCDEKFAGDEFYVFNAHYSRGQRVEFYIDTQFETQNMAQDIAGIYAPILGQMPYLLRSGVDVVIVRAENDNWCATTGHIEIEHGNYDEELADGALEESMMHETVHATLDDDYAASAEWINAQESDAQFVSNYAQGLPENEDLAETFTAYYGIIRNRLSDEDAQKLIQAIPARISFLQTTFPLSKLSIQ